MNAVNAAYRRFGDFKRGVSLLVGVRGAAYEIGVVGGLEMLVSVRIYILFCAIDFCKLFVYEVESFPVCGRVYD